MHVRRNKHTLSRKFKFPESEQVSHVTTLSRRPAVCPHQCSVTTEVIGDNLFSATLFFLYRTLGQRSRDFLQGTSSHSVYWSVKDRALEVLGTLQGNKEEGPMMGEYIGLMNDRGYDTLAN